MVKRNLIALLVCIVVIAGFVACGDDSIKETTKHEFSVAQKDFEMQGCTWNVEIPETFDVFYAVDNDSSPKVPIYPELGYFYAIHINVKPGENPYCNPRFLRFELIDVHGNRYYPVSSKATIDEYGMYSNLYHLSDVSEVSDTDVDSFILMDAPGGLKGLTLAIIYTGQDPEAKLYEVDLKR